MAHNLYKNKMAFHGEVPWHRLGVQFNEPFTAEQAIEAAGLGYEVQRQQLHLPDGKPVPNYYATVNGDTNDILGVVQGRYKILQNRDAFRFFDILMDEAGARYETAGAIGRGERVWLMARMPGGLMPVQGDEILPYCLLHNSHDGTGRVTVRFVFTRVVCQNTLAAAMAEAPELVSITHTASIEAKLEAAAIVLKNYAEHYALFGQRLTDLASFKITDDWLDDYLKALCGDPEADNIEPITATKRLRRIEEIESHYTHGMGSDIPGVVGTAWGAYNAAIEWCDYDFPTRGDGDRTESLLFGAGNRFRQTAFDTAMAMVSR